MPKSNAKSKSNLKVLAKLTSADLIHEVMSAYSDCHSEQAGYGERNLKFRASQPVHGLTLQAILNRAIPNGYNAFDSEVLKAVINRFGPGAFYTIAREGSVCLYIKPSKTLMTTIPFWGMQADEVSYNTETGEFRIWWD